MARVLVSAVVLCFLLASCIDDFEQAAVTASGDGALRVLYHPCGPGEAPQKIELLVDDGDTPGNGNDTVLWQATAGPGRVLTSDVMTFGPGNVPSGYAETVTLQTPATGSKVLVYLTIRGGGDGVLGFSWGSLRAGTLLTDAGTKTPAGWLKYAREGCGQT